MDFGETLSGRSACTRCGNFIPKGGHRGVVKDKQYNSNHFYCLPCSKEYILDFIKYYEISLRECKKFLKEDKKNGFV